MKAIRVRLAVVTVLYDVETPRGIERMNTWCCGETPKLAVRDWIRLNHIHSIGAETIHSGIPRPIAPSNYVAALHRFGRHSTDPDTPHHHPRLARLDNQNQLALKPAGNGGLTEKTA